MTDRGDRARFKRCSLDTDHEGHEHPGGWCDGLVYAEHAARAEQLAIRLLDETYGVTAHPRPWAPWTLPADLVEANLERLAAFVEFLNTTYAVDEKDLIPVCWPRHPGFVLHLSAVFAAWVEANQSAAAAPALAVTWHQQTLPALTGYVRTSAFGIGAQRCGLDRHDDAWSPAAEQLARYRDGAVRPLRPGPLSPAAGLRENKAAFPPPGK